VLKKRKKVFGLHPTERQSYKKAEKHKNPCPSMSKGAISKIAKKKKKIFSKKVSS